jgi:hypothetical protein
MESLMAVVVSRTMGFQDIFAYILGAAVYIPESAQTESTKRL